MCVTSLGTVVFAPKSSQTGGGFRSTRRWRRGGGLSSRPFEKRESRPRKNFSRPRGLQFGLIEVQSSKFIVRLCKVFKDKDNNTRGLGDPNHAGLFPSSANAKKTSPRPRKKRSTFVCAVSNRLNTCDAGSFRWCRRLLKII